MFSGNKSLPINQYLVYVEINASVDDDFFLYLVHLTELSFKTEIAILNSNISGQIRLKNLIY